MIYIAGSIADIQCLLAAVDENVPKEEGSFQKIEDDWIKDRCNFKKACE